MAENKTRAKIMEYVPQFTKEEIKENHQRLCQRLSLYKNRGLDFLKARKKILDLAQPLLGDILEVGCGTGYMSLALAEAGYDFVTIDMDKESLKITALNLAYKNLLSKVKFYIMDGTALTFAKRSFDNVVIVNLFHHIREIKKMLAQADRVLKSGGKLILADFKQRAMAIVDEVHRQEGRRHEDSQVSRDYVYSHFHKLGYGINSGDYENHWILICKKPGDGKTRGRFRITLYN